MRLHSSLVLMCLLGSAACITNPTNDHVYSHPTQSLYGPFRISGYAMEPNALVVVEVQNRSTNNWEVLARTRSSTTATNIWGSPNMYGWSINERITTNDPNSWCRWTPLCNAPANSNLRANIRARSGGMDLATFDEGYENCIYRKTQNGTGFIAAAQSCASPQSPVLTIRWVNNT